MMALGRNPRPLLGQKVQECPLPGWSLFSISGVGAEAPYQPTGAPTWAGPATVSVGWVVRCLARLPQHPLCPL